MKVAAQYQKWNRRIMNHSLDRMVGASGIKSAVWCPVKMMSPAGHVITAVVFEVLRKICRKMSLNRLESWSAIEHLKTRGVRRSQNDRQIPCFSALSYELNVKICILSATVTRKWHCDAAAAMPCYHLVSQPVWIYAAGMDAGHVITWSESRIEDEAVPPLQRA